MSSPPARCPLWLPFLPLFLVLDLKKNYSWLLPLELNLGSFCPPCLLPLFVAQFGFFLHSLPAALVCNSTWVLFALPACCPFTFSLGLSVFLLLEWVPSFSLSERQDRSRVLPTFMIPLPTGSRFQKWEPPITDLFVCCPSNCFVGFYFPSLPDAARLASSFTALDLSFDPVLSFSFLGKRTDFENHGSRLKIYAYPYPPVPHWPFPPPCLLLLPNKLFCWGVLQFSSLYAAQ